MHTKTLENYDFSAQEKMLLIAIKMIEKSNVKSPCTFGGGTALSAYYWQHRFSTDIDMFIHTQGNEKPLDLIRPLLRDSEIKKQLKAIGYDDSLKESGISFPGHYLEISINAHEKIQFFESRGYTSNPYSLSTVLGQRVLIESVDEIIAKKIFYRADKANARDIFDIALAVHKDPISIKRILDGSRVKLSHIGTLVNALKQIIKDRAAQELYEIDIKLMNPIENYFKLAIQAPIYLYDYLYTFYHYQGKLTQEELITLEQASYNERM